MIETMREIKVGTETVAGVGGTLRQRVKQKSGQQRGSDTDGGDEK